MKLGCGTRRSRGERIKRRLNLIRGKPSRGNIPTTQPHIISRRIQLIEELAAVELRFPPTRRQRLQNRRLSRIQQNVHRRQPHRVVNTRLHQLQTDCAPVVSRHHREGDDGNVGRAVPHVATALAILSTLSAGVSPVIMSW